MTSFGNWLEAKGRIDRTPITARNVSLPVAKMTATTQHRTHRRGVYSVRHLRDLLTAAERYPVVARSTNTGGRPRRDGTPSQQRNAVMLSDATLAMLRERGRERRLIYRTALLTGLRRGELSRVTVSMFDADRLQLRLPGHLTKNGKPALIPLTPTLAADLSAWVKDTGRIPAAPLLGVPDLRATARIHQATLKHAGMDYEDAEGRFRDFHALRKTLNTYLIRHGVSERERKMALRHADTSVTGKHYDTAADLTPTQTGRVRLLLAKLDSRLSLTPAPAATP